MSRSLLLATLITFFTGCESVEDLHFEQVADSGPHGGRLLTDGEIALELAIFESGLPPEYRVWVSRSGEAIDPATVEVKVTLSRLGGQQDQIGFVAAGDHLRGDTVVREPHSFEVAVSALIDGRQHNWAFESFEGRTRIDAQVARAMGVETAVAGATRLQEVIELFGEVVPDQERQRSVSARFDGLVESVPVAVGDVVREGQELARVESNESLKTYPVSAPIAGSVVARHAGPGEQTAGRVLFELLDTRSVWVDLAVFPSERDRIRVGAAVALVNTSGESVGKGVITWLNVVAEANQSVLARVVIDNADGLLVPGQFLTGRVAVATHEVPLAVRREALQPFRDFDVVFARVGDQYEVRMLELGREDDVWVEVLAGLDAGTEYVTANSYLIKADIEKSGAAHDH